MKKIFYFVVFVGLFLIRNDAVMAVEKEVFDSTDHYLGACQLTNKSEWEVKEDIQVSKFQVWYRWNQNEATLPVKIFFNGEKFAEFEATRGSCDPYQQTWCNADFQINKLFPKGKYSTEIPNSRQCLKPNGTGAIRLYVESGTEEKVSLTNTVIPTIAPTTAPTVEPTIIQAAPKQIVTPVNTCNCSTNTILVTAAGTSAVISLLVSILLRR